MNTLKKLYRVMTGKLVYVFDCGMDCHWLIWRQWRFGVLKYAPALCVATPKWIYVACLYPLKIARERYTVL